jgi:hypothetical protein
MVFQLCQEIIENMCCCVVTNIQLYLLEFRQQNDNHIGEGVFYSAVSLESM